MHGFAVGQLDRASVNIEPGKVTDLILTFDKPGVYTYFCTRWCGVDPWQIRGMIKVTANADVSINVPLYVSLGLDIDAPHESPVVPETQPSAIHGDCVIPIYSR